MAGFEVVVRPVVFPNIRPPRARVIVSADTPEKGVATLNGSGTQTVALPYNYSMNFSRAKDHVQEQERVVDTARVYQKEQAADGGETVNRANYLDVDAVRRITGVDAEGARRYIHFARVQPLLNVEILKSGTTMPNPDYKSGVITDSRLPII
jgi:hypothetical protein